MSSTEDPETARPSWLAERSNYADPVLCSMWNLRKLELLSHSNLPPGFRSFLEWPESILTEYMSKRCLPSKKKGRVRAKKLKYAMNSHECFADICDKSRPFMSELLKEEWNHRSAMGSAELRGDDSGVAPTLTQGDLPFCCCWNHPPEAREWIKELRMAGKGVTLSTAATRPGNVTEPQNARSDLQGEYAGTIHLGSNLVSLFLQSPDRDAEDELCSSKVDTVPSFGKTDRDREDGTNSCPAGDDGGIRLSPQVPPETPRESVCSDAREHWDSEIDNTYSGAQSPSEDASVGGPEGGIRLECDLENLAIHASEGENYTSSAASDWHNPDRIREPRGT